MKQNNITNVVVTDPTIEEDYLSTVGMYDNTSTDVDNTIEQVYKSEKFIFNLDTHNHYRNGVSLPPVGISDLLFTLTSTIETAYVVDTNISKVM